jgi:hypothetical protein
MRGEAGDNDFPDSACGLLVEDGRMKQHVAAQEKEIAAELLSKKELARREVSRRAITSLRAYRAELSSRKPNTV